MKKFSTLVKNVELKESIGMNPGNSLACGVTNHYTPIDNIITNVRNLFGSMYSLVVTKYTDNVSLCVTSSNFGCTETSAREYLYKCTCGGKSLASYIYDQGLTEVSLISTGPSQFTFRFFAKDIAVTDPNTVAAEIAAIGPSDACSPAECYESELTIKDVILKEDEEEMNDTTVEDFSNIINMDNKIKAAEAFAEKISSQIPLPEYLYIKATKDSDNNQSIALRYKYEKPRPFGKKQEIIVSVMNIFHTGHDGIWVDAFVNKGVFDSNVTDVIENILKMIGAESTSNPAIWEIPDNTVVNTEETTDEPAEDSDSTTDMDDNFNEE